ncbi:MAG: STAS domain-containing protein [Solirubrobacteraceae bacterium]
MRANGAPESSITFAISQRELDRRTRVLAVEGELDLASAPRLKWALSDVLGAGYSQVVLDLAGVTFIDSTALGVLIGVQRRRDVPARLGIVCVHPNVLRIFELSGLDGMFDIFSTFDAALAYARGSATATA